MTDTPEYGLGRVPSKPDPRNANFMAAGAPHAKQLKRRVWPVGQVFDQGQTSQCVAYSGIAALIAMPCVNFPNMRFDELYAECQKIDEWAGENYDGTSIAALMKVLKKRELISEYRWAFNVKQLADYILTKGPAICGVNWYQDLFMPDEHGFIHVGGHLVGGHAFLTAGVDVEKKCPDGSTGAFRKIGSWSRKWGQNGRAWISFKDMERLISEQGEIAMFAESKQN